MNRSATIQAVWAIALTIAQTIMPGQMLIVFAAELLAMLNLAH